MSGAWIPAVIMAAGMAWGIALAAYALWIIRTRQDGIDGRLPPGAAMAMSLVNGLGWLMSWLICPTAAEAVELGVYVSAAVVFTAIDCSIRIIPNELVAALLALTAAVSLLGHGFGQLPGRAVGLLVALTLFLVAMLIAGPGKVGGGDVKLAAAVGFATGFPGVLAAILIMALAAAATGGVAVAMRRMGRKTPMPFAGFLMAGLVAADVLDKLGALNILK